MIAISVQPVELVPEHMEVHDVLQQLIELTPRDVPRPILVCSLEREQKGLLVGQPFPPGRGMRAQRLVYLGD